MKKLTQKEMNKVLLMLLLAVLCLGGAVYFAISYFRGD
jgi:hypothetical protein